MQEINEFIKENPKMRLKEISKMYNVSVSNISKRRAFIGIKHGTSDICKMIQNLLHLKNIEIANKLGCTQILVAHVRFLQKNKQTTQKVELTDEQKEIVKANYNTMTIAKLSELIGVTTHVLRNRILEMNLHNNTERYVNFYDYSLDNGNGFFDLEKYKQVML
jgi:hypothetical protein